jgi:diaminohydroxyphosphoribosylaminopyrimidine deaminase / 5-amino-6-(5-phosphoribosylamino)uracil reductase
MCLKEAMRQAVLAAHSVEGRTSPRPPVGAVLVRNGQIVGRGATAPPYGPHAEVQALTEAGPAAQGADLYVTLEPCCTMLHTPPCTKAIVAAGVRRVFVGALDPNPAVCTRGIRQLQRAGIDVVLLEHEHEALALIRPFATFITQGRSYVTAKWAMTLDGKLATRTKTSAWISGVESRLWVHDLRDRVDAILVGAQTARIDNPQLTVRLSPEQRCSERTMRHSPPLRIVLATHGRLPDHLALLQSCREAETWIVVGETCAAAQHKHLESLGVHVLPVPVDERARVSLPATLQVLAQQGIVHVLLEGGATLLGSAFDQHCIDHVAAFIAPILIGGGEAPSPIGGEGLAEMIHACQLHNRRTQFFGEDILVEGDVVYEPPPSPGIREEQKLYAQPL